MGSFFDPSGVVFHPFTGTRVADFAGFQAAFGDFFAIAEGLKFSPLEFTALDDPDAVITRYTGHATITTTGKSYDQTYLNEVHVHGDKVKRYVEYFDTFVLYDALGFFDQRTT